MKTIRYWLVNLRHKWVRKFQSENSIYWRIDVGALDGLWVVVRETQDELIIEHGRVIQNGRVLTASTKTLEKAVWRVAELL